MQRDLDGMGRRDFLALAAATLGASGLGSGAAALEATRDEPAGRSPARISYYKDGAIHVGVVGQSDGSPVTSGHWDFKPSWSMTEDKLLCFRRTKDDPVTVDWESFVFVVGVDGSGFHPLCEAAPGNFNPTWSRDGRNTPIWNRKNPKTGSFHVIRSRIGAGPGQESEVTDPGYHTWVFSTLTDGRLLVSSMHPKQGWGLYFLKISGTEGPEYEPISCELAKTGLLDRVSISPSEKRVCFEYQKGFEYKDPGRTLYIADLDPNRRTITHPKPIANAAGLPVWFAYPRWIEGEAAVIYHASGGKGQLFVYRLADGTTKRVSTDPNADYRYPHGEAAPC